MGAFFVSGAVMVANYQVGQTFAIHFVWQLPDGDYLRVVFEAEVLDWDLSLDRYLLRLQSLTAGRQDDPAGQPRPVEQISQLYWKYAQQLVGRRVYLAFEVDDGRPILLRLVTLTGEHSFFTRLDEPQVQGKGSPAQ